MKLVYKSSRMGEIPETPAGQGHTAGAPDRNVRKGLLRVDLLDSYRNFYQFRETPFSVSPNPRMFYFSGSHAEALNHLRYGIYEGLGFTMITGEPGTGKTMLSRYFLSKAGKDLCIVTVFHPHLSGSELLLAVLEGLGVGRSHLGEMSERRLACRLYDLLVAAQDQSKKVVIFLDEAQRLDFEFLESLRLLSNLETQDQKLLQVVLFGQTELEERLQEERLRQLDQRILVRYRLQPFELEETRCYIQHQLSVAGISFSVQFTVESTGKIHDLSGGIPRMINVLCERAMMSGFIEGSRKIGVHNVVEGWESLNRTRTLGGRVL